MKTLKKFLVCYLNIEDVKQIHLKSSISALYICFFFLSVSSMCANVPVSGCIYDSNSFLMYAVKRFHEIKTSKDLFIQSGYLNLLKFTWDIFFVCPDNTL